MDWQLTAETQKHVAREQHAMTRREEQELARALATLRKSARALEEKGRVNPDRLHASVVAWENFADKDSALYASLAEGGSMEAMLHHSHVAALARARIDMIEDWINRDEGEF